MSLVEATGQVVALYNQNELHAGRAGRRGGVCAQDLPRAHHQGDGRFGDLGAGAGPVARKRHAAYDRCPCAVPGRFPVKFNVADQDRELFLAAGAAGSAAIYTQQMHAIHIIRKVILRVGSYTDYLILKLH